MTQKYKAVYFPDFPHDDSKQKSLTLAFGSKSSELFESVRDLTSEDIRQLLGSDSYKGILGAAQTEDLPLNRYCIRQIKRALKSAGDTNGQSSFSELVGHKNIFDPVSVTFKGGSLEPFVRWYPYLQGYSPQFVEAILKKYAPDSEILLDPFAGTGTTVFTASHLNIKPYFCEINPVLQYISLTKIRVRRLDAAKRLKLSQELVESIQNLKELGQYEKDSRLNESYQECFVSSQFFDEATYEKILRLRSWLDVVSLTKPLVADLITVAVLAALVPASRMRRVGDLRYKTANEASRYAAEVRQDIGERILQIAEDICNDINGLKLEPLLIAENALSLANIPRLNVDTVITSPPYVNGTNYFRNTKIELWFLRCLNHRSDLAKYRSEALTAGINDVTVGKVRVIKHPDVRRIVALLEENAYDSRIPRMIGSYFSEISEVFGHICRHLTDRATVAIDIGDSCYGGVHVPVDRLLSVCLEELGLVEEDRTELRQRRSKGGTVLKQVLLVYKYNSGKAGFYAMGSALGWKLGWESFKSRLPHQQAPYTKRNWGHPLHSLCSYPGKMKPAIAHHLVNIFVPEGGILLDPFAGVGTIPFEGALQGKISYGFEISPAAFTIASGKAQSHSLIECDQIIKDLGTFIDNSKPTKQELKDSCEFGFNGKLIDYYHPDTLGEIVLARRFFKNRPARTSEEFFVLASLLHILHGNRPYALSRRSHPLTPYKPTGPIEYRSLVVHLREKVERGLKEQLPCNFRPFKMLLQDATIWWPKEIDELDAVVTSPPFFDSTRFYLANWIRLWFCGWNQLDFEGRPLGFVEERQKTSFDVYIPILRQAREHLKKDGVMVLHLGKSVKCNMSDQLMELGKKWFSHAEMVEESVSHCESHGIRDKGTVKFHQYLVLY